MERLVHDLRIALRGLRHTPTFTVTVVLVLGIGIGMSAAMLTVFRAVLIQRLPVVDQNRIVVLWTVRDGSVEAGANKSIIERVRREAHTLQDVAGVSHWGVSAEPLSDGDRSIVLNQAVVDGNFFDLLGTRPALGRLLRREDEAGGKFQAASFKALEHAIVISYGVWKQDFDGDPAVIGRHLGDPYAQWDYTIVGVAPPGLDYPAGVGYWVPIGKDIANQGDVALARLKPGATPAAARAEYFSMVQRLAPDWHLTGATVRTLPEQVVGDVRPAIEVMTAAVGLLLVIACADVANLLLVRAAGRGREIAIRRAIGARSADLMRQLGVESGVLAVAGGLLGLVCAVALLRVLSALAPADLPRIDVIRMTGAPVALAVATTVVAVLCFGVGPALVAARSDVGSPLRIDARSGAESVGRRRLRQTLVASQVSLALVMVTGAGLLAHSLARLQRLNLGYRPDHLSFFTISMPTEVIADQAKAVALGDMLIPQLRAIPGVTAITPVTLPPLIGANVLSDWVQVEGQSLSDARQAAPVPMDAGGPDYFRTLGIPLLRGHGFSNPDGAGAPHEVVVSEGVAGRLWPGQNPIGKLLRNPYIPDSSWRTVVGVVPDIHLRSLREPTPMLFLRWRQSFWQGIVAVRTTGSLASVLPAIRRVVHDTDPRLTLAMAETMDDYLAVPLAEPRLNALLLSGFGLVALLLAALGLYGVMASAVRQQTHEIGVRMALGATSARVRREVLRGALGITAVGTVVGVVVALASSKLFSALLFEVSPTDPIALSGACLLLLGVALGAAYLPGRRATRVDPAQALRAE